MKYKRYILKSLFRLGLFKPQKQSLHIKWGVIGLGYMAETLSTAIDFSLTGKIAAVASRSEAKAVRFAKRHGNCKAYSNYDSMIFDQKLDLDIVYICTPLETHRELIEKCLRAGRNVICEKPITTNYSDLKHLKTLASDNNCLLLEAMWMKCLPTFQKASELVKSGAIGRVQLVRADLNKNELYDSRHHLSTGGVLANFGVYSLAFVTSFLNGAPDKYSSTVRYSSSGVDTNWHIHSSKNGIVGIINLSSNFLASNNAIVVGEKGAIVWDSQFNRANTITLVNHAGKDIKKFCFEYRFEGFEYMLDEVAYCILNHLTDSEVMPLKDSITVTQWMSMLLEHNKAPF